ncbi:hypothetical protein [Brevundimonas sp. UBA7534]|uniref:hypothetical protein n=1 Tax=Brevundimonas sp. UBA7534 TaxID=1946138 RepID=UPI0025BDD435|nr:hypothetical protein [Brevundimonas sp. UBA7534]
MALFPITVFAGVLLSIIPVNVQAQGGPTVRQRMFIASEADASFTFGHTRASLGWRWSHPFEDATGSVTVFAERTAEGAPPGQPTRPVFIARQVERVSGDPEAVRWADSDGCPALLRLMHDFEALRVPSTVIPGLTWPPRFPVVTLDGTVWTIWTRDAQQGDRSTAYVQMSSNAGEIAAWGQRSREALSGCWSDDQPSILGDVR